jgi:hypothetical protein
VRRALATLAVVLTSSVAGAQRLPPRPPPPPPQGAEKPPELGDLKGRFGVAVAQRLLAGSSEDRARGMRRLAAIGTPQAIDLLVQAADVPGPLPLREHLAAVRALAAHADEDGPRRVLVAALRDVSGDAPGPALVRDTAALALARHGGARGENALFALLRQGGPVGAAAARALIAAPPASVDGLFGARAPVSAQVASLASAMGDLRAIPWLRRAVRAGDPATRAASLVAMSVLGDGQAISIARGWAPEKDALARIAAAQALAASAPAEARAIVVGLLSDAQTRGAALDLARDVPGESLVPALTAIASDATADGDDRSRAVECLGRAGAAAALVSLVARDDVSADAALALALAPGAEARRAVESLLGDPARRALGVRAAIVRTLSTGDRPSGLAAAVAALPASERALAAFVAVALGDRAVDDPALLADDDVVAAVARAALARPDGELALLGPALAASSPGPRRDALGVALLASPADAPVSTSTLLAWVEENGAIAPLAVRALAARDDESTRARLAFLLASPDTQLRAHVAAGLSRSPEPDATGRLAAAYEIELDAPVRRAIVAALGRRPDDARRRALSLAADLDPDASVRALAQRGLGGGRPAERTRGARVAFATVTGNARAALRWQLPDGLVVPVVADGGFVLVPGLPPGTSRARVADIPVGSAAP